MPRVSRNKDRRKGQFLRPTKRKEYLSHLISSHLITSETSHISRDKTRRLPSPTPTHLLLLFFFFSSIGSQHYTSHNPHPLYAALLCSLNEGGENPPEGRRTTRVELLLGSPPQGGARERGPLPLPHNHDYGVDDQPTYLPTLGGAMAGQAGKARQSETKEPFYS
ncbi:hypothetical protein GJ744_000848 [Endocarpon pusillum]|uniref:Uncharacterized protein n=1 Tax=Endocarpon pusillum TaxID=364733 RepID=A0A8H7ATC2_9EURO|nr:hypothetical protein GJ744_000848 [Endocarpon pusillum]